MNALRYLDFGASRDLLLLIARIAIVLLFILFGYPKMLHFDGTVQYMAASGATDAFPRRHYCDCDGSACRYPW